MWERCARATQRQLLKNGTVSLSICKYRAHAPACMCDLRMCLMCLHACVTCACACGGPQVRLRRSGVETGRVRHQVVPVPVPPAEHLHAAVVPVSVWMSGRCRCAFSALPYPCKGCACLGGSTSTRREHAPLYAHTHTHIHTLTLWVSRMRPAFIVPARLMPSGHISHVRLQLNTYTRASSTTDHPVECRDMLAGPDASSILTSPITDSLSAHPPSPTVV